MKHFTKKFQPKVWLEKLQNRWVNKIGLFLILNEREYFLKKREINKNYKKIIIDESHFSLLKHYSDSYRSKDHFEKHIKPRVLLKNRYKGFAIIDAEKEEIAYLCWIDFERLQFNEAGVEKFLKPNEAYFFDDDCVIHHQRKGLHAHIFQERLNYCKAKNVDRIFIIVFLNNFRAMSNLKRYNIELYQVFKRYPILERLKKVF